MNIEIPELTAHDLLDTLKRQIDRLHCMGIPHQELDAQVEIFGRFLKRHDERQSALETSPDECMAKVRQHFDVMPHLDTCGLKNGGASCTCGLL